MRTASSPPARFRPLATRDPDEPVRDDRTRLRASELHAADTRGLSSAHGRRSPRPCSRDPRGPALEQLGRKLLVIDVDDPLYDGPGGTLGELEYEAFLAEGSPDFEWRPPRDESQAIALNYTSGTTGNPKGVVYHHRGTFLVAVGNVLAWDLPPRAVYLWTLPLFHCNGWCYSWAVTLVGGTHVCLRKVDPPLVFRLIAEHRVTNMCGAPTVLSILINAPAEKKERFDHV